jgi:hypothetical protein
MVAPKRPRVTRWHGIKKFGVGDRRGLGPLPISIPGTVVLNSRPGGGKSHLIEYLIYMNRGLFSHGIVFSKSIFRKGNMAYIPDYDGSPENKRKYMNFKHAKFDPTKLQALLDLQASYPDEERPLAFVIVDDELSTPHMWDCSATIDAATMYRHYNIVMFISTQYVNKVCTTIRECASQVGLFHMDTLRAINAAWEAYGQVEFDKYQPFKEWLDNNTNPDKGRRFHFCWKDKSEGTPWRVCLAPAKIPRFRLEYGQRAAARATRGTKRKGASSRKRAAKRSNTVPPIGANFAQLMDHVSSFDDGRDPCAEKTCHNGAPGIFFDEALG